MSDLTSPSSERRKYSYVDCQADNTAKVIKTAQRQGVNETVLIAKVQQFQNEIGALISALEAGENLAADGDDNFLTGEQGHIGRPDSINVTSKDSGRDLQTDGTTKDSGTSNAATGTKADEGRRDSHMATKNSGRDSQTDITSKAGTSSSVVTGTKAADGIDKVLSWKVDYS